jgi:hypothetical protein
MLRFAQFAKGAWVRTCQECMKPQATPAPQSYLNETWRDLQCKFCHSEALDYGQVNTEINLDDDSEF